MNTQATKTKERIEARLDSLEERRIVLETEEEEEEDEDN